MPTTKFPIEEYGRKVYGKHEVTLREISTGEIVRRTVIFARFLKDDLPMMCKMHNEAWDPENKYPSLRLELEHFQSQFKHFPGLGGFIVDTTDNGEVRSLVPVIGINPLRINSKITMDGDQPERWLISEKDEIPMSWNECTNWGTYDVSTAVKGERIWPSVNGDTVVCPTVYAKKVIQLGGKVYQAPALMGDIINAVVALAKEISQTEQRDIKIIAYSAPRDFAAQREEYAKRGVPNLPIEEYLFSTIPPKGIFTYAEYCKRHELEKVTEEEWIKELYSVVYLKNGGKLIYNEFKQKVLEFMIMGIGRKAYRLYRETYGPIDVEDFIHITARNLLDSVIGRHIKFGAKIGKIISNGREDPAACNYNIVMCYPTVKYEREGIEELSDAKQKPIITM